MKKYLSLLCMIACIFGLSACGTEEEYTTYEQNKMDYAISVATDYFIPSLESFESEEAVAALDEYTAEEVAYLINQNVGITVDGYVYKSAIESFNDGKEDIGGIVSMGEATATIDDDTIIVTVPVTGATQDAEAEVILSNDMFLEVQSAALNPVETMGDMMAKAAMNTLIGMGTVFVVLILISCIIALFGYIPKLQASMKNGKKANKEPKKSGIDNAVAQITKAEEVGTDDTELVAVIAAAIAAYEGNTSTDGFVVRSIHKVR